MRELTYNLFLDDIRCPEECNLYKTKYMPLNRAVYTQEPWKIVRNYAEFVLAIKTELSVGRFPKLVSFDHDLADIHYDPKTWTETFTYLEETGKDAAQWFVQFCIENDLELPECIVHSMNPIGAERIYNELQDYYKFKERFKK